MSASDFVVTIHAFERIEQRFPDLVAGLDDQAQAELIHREIHEGLDAGRHGTVPPIELSARGTERWITRTPSSYYVWTQDKQRGYLVVEDPEEGLVVLTLVYGIAREEAVRQRLKRRR